MRGYHVPLLILASAVVCTTSDRMTDARARCIYLIISFSEIIIEIGNNRRSQGKN